MDTAENQQQLLPNVSILIPSHNRPQFLREALESALNQTYPNIEIIIGDTSTDDRVENMMQDYLKKNGNIRYFRSDVDIFVDNFHKLFDLASGEFISYLHDDDLFHREKIERMIKYFLSDPAIRLVTSHRQTIDEIGKHFWYQSSYNRISEETRVFEGIELINHCLSNMINQIGEPSTVMYRKKDMEELHCKPGNYKGYQYENLLDLSTWVLLLSKGKGVYISDTLSYCRVHSAQLTKKVDWTDHYSEWLYLILSSREDGFLSTDELYMKALSNYKNFALAMVPNKPKYKVEVQFINYTLEAIQTKVVLQDS